VNSRRFCTRTFVSATWGRAVRCAEGASAIDVNHRSAVRSATKVPWCGVLTGGQDRESVPISSSSERGAPCHGSRLCTTTTHPQSARDQLSPVARSVTAAIASKKRSSQAVLATGSCVCGVAFGSPAAGSFERRSSLRRHSSYGDVPPRCGSGAGKKARAERGDSRQSLACKLEEDDRVRLAQIGLKRKRHDKPAPIRLAK
jgi:hypothetical protein